jgi:hypothetical protein
VTQALDHISAAVISFEGDTDMFRSAAEDWTCVCMPRNPERERERETERERDSRHLRSCLHQKIFNGITPNLNTMWGDKAF